MTTAPVAGKPPERRSERRARWASLGLDLVTLRILIAAAEERSLAAAAVRENISISAVSRRISDLEARIGVVVFDRHDRGVTLTEAGGKFVEQLGDVFDMLEQIALDLESTREGVRGLIRLHAHMSATLGPLPVRIAAFQAAHPHVRVQLTEATSITVAHAVSIGTADLGMISGTLPTENLHVIPWHADELVAVLPPGHRLVEKEEVRLEDLVDEPFIGLQKDSALLALYRQHARALGRSLDERAHTASFESVRSLVSAGLGVGILPALAVKGLAATEVQVRPLRESWATRPLMLCLRSLDRLSAATKLLIAHLTSAADRPVPHFNPPERAREAG